MAASSTAFRLGFGLWLGLEAVEDGGELHGCLLPLCFGSIFSFSSLILFYSIQIIHFQGLDQG